MSNAERLFYIDAGIRERGAITVEEVVRRFDVSTRQVKRDFEYLRDRLGAPLEWDAAQRRHVYARPWDRLGHYSEKTLLFYVFARAAAGTLAYVPVAESDALENLRNLVPKDLRSLEHSIRYELPGFEPVDGERISVLIDAIRMGRAVKASYRDIEGKNSRRILVPRRILNYVGTWYCLAFDPAIRELRLFRFSRFQSISPNTDSAEQGPSEAEVDRYLDASFGMYKGKADKKARIRFTGKAREIVRRELWHPGQSCREGRDPERGPWLEMELPVSRWEEILGRILRFGAEAEAIAPREFRMRWLEVIDSMADLAEKARRTKRKTGTRGVIVDV